MSPRTPPTPPTPPNGRLPVALATLFTACAAATSAQAAGFPGQVAVVAASFAEAATPDLRYEWQGDDGGFVLTWPVGYGIWSRAPGFSTPGLADPGLRLELFLDPHYVLRDERLRIAGWTRFHVWSAGGLGAFADGGYVVGQDGHGPSGGLGLAIGAFDLGMLGVSARYTRVGGEDRFDVGLDVRWWFEDLF